MALGMPPAGQGEQPPPIGSRSLLVVECGAFGAACRGGHLGPAKWMHREFGFTAADLHGERNLALFDAAASGCVELVEWMVTQFGFTADDAQRDSGILRRPCMSGDIGMVQRLIGLFDLCDPGRPTRSTFATILDAVEGGHLHIAQLLVTRLESTGARIPREWLAAAADKSPCPEAARWLTDL